MSRGFSFIETIVAIGILTGGLVTLAHVLSLGVQVAAGSRYRTAATIFAQQKLEQIRAEAVLADTASSVEHRDTLGEKVCDTDDPCREAFVTARWSISPVVSSPPLVMVRIVVSHAWRNHGEVRSFAIRPRSIR
jgi:Tfp pilus assembly protein PilV